MTIQNLKQGTSLYLALVITTIMLAMALGLSSIFIGQTKTIKQMGNSVIALCAADTGIEKALLNRSNPVNIPETPLWPNGATYRVLVSAGGTGGCPAGKHSGGRPGTGHSSAYHPLSSRSA